MGAHVRVGVGAVEWTRAGSSSICPAVSSGLVLRRQLHPWIGSEVYFNKTGQKSLNKNGFDVFLAWWLVSRIPFIASPNMCFSLSVRPVWVWDSSAVGWELSLRALLTN